MRNSILGASFALNSSRTKETELLTQEELANIIVVREPSTELCP